MESEHDHDAVLEGDAVLDIGDGVGALILLVDAVYQGREVEISPETDDAGRTHTAIHERRHGGRTVFAGIFPSLPAGPYRVWTDDPSLEDRVLIVDGEVAELDWRRSRD